MFRFVRAVVLSVVVLSVLPVTAGVASASRTDSAYLGALWTKVFETPNADNPFGSGGAASGCFALGNALAPFGPSGVPSCTARPGTKVFVTGSSFECSTFEGNGTTYAQLLTCARQSDLQAAPVVTIDGTALPMSEVVTGPLELVLPPDNIFGIAAGSTGLSAAHGWVALLHPLASGTHLIVINTPAATITTAIIVNPHA
jgi:hypothetical protein